MTLNSTLTEVVTCDRSDHVHASLEESRSCAAPDDRCPEYCGHLGYCAEQSEAISRAERAAELAAERYFEERWA